MPQNYASNYNQLYTDPVLGMVTKSTLYLLGKELQTRGVKGGHKYHQQEFTLRNSPSRCLSLKYLCQE